VSHFKVLSFSITFLSVGYLALRSGLFSGSLFFSLYLHFRAGQWLGSACFNLWGVCFFYFPVVICCICPPPTLFPLSAPWYGWSIRCFRRVCGFFLRTVFFATCLYGSTGFCNGFGWSMQFPVAAARVIISSAVLFTMGWGYSDFLKRGQ